MSKVRILVVDDEEKWQKALPDVLSERWHSAVTVELAPDYSTALEKVRSRSYDLVSVDLDLLGDLNPATNPNLEAGMDLLKICRASSRNRGCGLLVLSGRATPNAVYQALERHGVNVFLDKQDFSDGTPYLEAVQKAIRRARLQEAERRLEHRYQLTLAFNENGLSRGDLSGPGHSSEAHVTERSATELDDLARRADDLNRRLSSGDPGAWREEARSIGVGVYQTIVKQREMLTLFSTARALAASEEVGELSLRFSGPPGNLSVPFELVRDADDYFALFYGITRRISQESPRIARKAEPFNRFIRTITAANEPLRILLAGANSEGRLKAVDREVSLVAESIRSDLNILGVTNEITVLVGEDLTFNRLGEALREGQHILHFAGHGNFDESLAEKSPLMLDDRKLTAAQLQLLTQGTELQFVFLSSCLAARTAKQVGRGDFHGFLHALSQAAVPATLAYRWNVRDSSAVELATSFYQFLWCDLSLEKALLRSRQKLTMGKLGRDDETWAAPVLVTST